MPLLKPWESAAIELFRKHKDTKVLKQGTRIIRKACEDYALQFLDEIVKVLERRLDTQTLKDLLRDLKKRP